MSTHQQLPAAGYHSSDEIDVEELAGLIRNATELDHYPNAMGIEGAIVVYTADEDIIEVLHLGVVKFRRIIEAVDRDADRGTGGGGGSELDVVEIDFVSIKSTTVGVVHGDKADFQLLSELRGIGAGAVDQTVRFPRVRDR